jgi:NAD-dependent histone deacetylase SIR2
MGTSLKVHGLKVMVKEFAKAVHVRGGKVVFVNRTKPPESTWGEFIDYWVEWDCDEWVLDLQERRGDIWLPQGTQVESNNRRESSGETKTQAKKPSTVSRPQAVRDDKMNGVYNTFRILDSLRQIKDSSGATANRPMYWDKPVRTVVTAVKAESGKQSRKSLPAAKSSSKEGSNTKKRKSCPSVLEDDKDKSPYIVADMWERLRKLAPSLAPTPPESSRIALTELHINRGFPINNIYTRSFPSQFPNLAGLPLPKINLITHPPSGADVPIHTPKSAPKPTIERKPITHSYGTRASARLSGTSAETRITVESTITVDETPSRSSLPSWPSNEDTIVVTNAPCLSSPPSTEDTIVVTNAPCLSSLPSAEDTIVVADTPHLPSLPSRPSTGDTIVVDSFPTEDEMRLTPPITDPMTPSTQRIKRLGSIEAILSSPENSGCSSATTVYYDAEDR